MATRQRPWRCWPDRRGRGGGFGMAECCEEHPGAAGRCCPQLPVPPRGTAAPGVRRSRVTIAAALPALPSSSLAGISGRASAHGTERGRLPAVLALRHTSCVGHGPVATLPGRDTARWARDERPSRCLWRALGWPGVPEACQVFSHSARGTHRDASSPSRNPRAHWCRAVGSWQGLGSWLVTAVFDSQLLSAPSS